MLKTWKSYGELFMWDWMSYGVGYSYGLLVVESLSRQHFFLFIFNVWFFCILFIIQLYSWIFTHEFFFLCCKYFEYLFWSQFCSVILSLYVLSKYNFYVVWSCFSIIGPLLFCIPDRTVTDLIRTTAYWHLLLKWE